MNFRIITPSKIQKFLNSKNIVTFAKVVQNRLIYSDLHHVQ